MNDLAAPEIDVVFTWVNGTDPRLIAGAFLSLFSRSSRLSLSRSVCVCVCVCVFIGRKKREETHTAQRVVRDS